MKFDENGCSRSFMQPSRGDLKKERSQVELVWTTAEVRCFAEPHFGSQSLCSLAMQFKNVLGDSK